MCTFIRIKRPMISEKQREKMTDGVLTNQSSSSLSVQSDLEDGHPILL